MVYSRAIIRVDLLYEFKNHLKATETAYRIRNASGLDDLQLIMKPFKMNHTKVAMKHAQTKKSKSISLEIFV